MLERIRASRAMTTPIAGPSALRAMSLPVDDDEMGPPSSLDVAADLIEAAAEPGPSRRSGDVVLSNGWSWTCGPVSATTGQPASGCEFMPPTRWDLVSPVALVASVLPVTGEVVDAVDCAVGAIPCEAVLLPGFSGRVGRAVDDLLGAATHAARPARSVDEILMPGGVPLGRRGSSTRIREVTGDVADAEATFIELSRGGELTLADPNQVIVRLPDGGFVGLRTKMSALSASSVATIDVKINGYDIRKIKYNP